MSILKEPTGIEPYSRYIKNKDPLSRVNLYLLFEFGDPD